LQDRRPVGNSKTQRADPKIYKITERRKVMAKLSEIEGIGEAYSTKLEKVGGLLPWRAF